mmetsp:Transcript_7959/g.16433  ORF Transcript_7959/g.16433 Transcript_7959/m.16433 type:complete len:423 (-) Transcript_7959:513-1781(-)
MCFVCVVVIVVVVVHRLSHTVLTSLLRGFFSSSRRRRRRRAALRPGFRAGFSHHQVHPVLPLVAVGVAGFQVLLDGRVVDLFPVQLQYVQDRLVPTQPLPPQIAGRLVELPVRPVQRLEVLVEAVGQGDGPGQTQVDDLLSRNVLEFHDEGPEVVLVADDQHRLSGLQFRGDRFVPVDARPGLGVPQGFRFRDEVFHVAVARVPCRVVLVAVAHRGGWLVVGPPPGLDLFLSVDLDGFLLVLADELAVVALVQSPVLVNGDVFLLDLHQDQVGRSDAPPQQRRVDLVEQDAAVLEHFPGHPCLQDAVVGQRGVGPADEPVVAVPGALAVAQETEIVRGLVVDAGEFPVLLTILLLTGRTLWWLLVVVLGIAAELLLVLLLEEFLVCEGTAQQDGGRRRRRRRRNFRRHSAWFSDRFCETTSC